MNENVSTPGGRSRLLFRPEEVASLLAISRSRVYELIASGALESVTLGHSRRVPAQSLDAFVQRLRGRDGQEMS
jgi:excisionase family DNA binding protein